MAHPLVGGIVTGFSLGIGFRLAAEVLNLFQGVTTAQLGRGGMRRTTLGRGRLAQTVHLGGGVYTQAGIQKAIILGNDITKTLGELVTAAVSWSNTTVNSSGAPISWPFRLRLFSGALPNTGFVGFTPGANQARTDNLVGTIPTNTITGPYQVSVILEAANSDASGNPLTTFSQLQNFVVGTLTVASTSGGAAVPGGSIGGVTVSQSSGGLRRRRLMQSNLRVTP